MISQTAEYALRAVVYLANQAGQACTTAQLADEIAAPAGYLAKVMKGLGRSGIVTSQRGPHGGFKLAGDPNDLTILDVISAVDAFHRIEHCPMDQPGHSTELCPLHRRIDDLLAAAEEGLSRTTVGELLASPGLLCSLRCTTEPVTLNIPPATDRQSQPPAHPPPQDS